MPNPLKAELRKFYIAKRDQMSANQRSEKTRQINQWLLRQSEFNNAQTVGFYCAFGSEVDTTKMMKTALGLGKKIFLPTINPKDKTMTYSEHDGNLDNLACNFYGILEPLGPPQDSRILDLIIVPGVAFDKHGWRLGYGAGYYDRFLKQVEAKTIGIVFSEQIHSALPVGKYDMPVDIVITDKRCLKLSK